MKGKRGEQDIETLSPSDMRFLFIHSGMTYSEKCCMLDQ